MKPSKKLIRAINVTVAAAGRFLLFLLAWFCLCLAPGAQAASITWGTATTISADTDVSTSGTLVYAYNEQNAAATVNTVPFAAGSSTSSLGGGNVTMSGFTANAASTFGGGATAPWNGLSANYQTVLSGAAYGSTAAATITLNNLTVNHTYQVQIWVNDSRSGASATRTETVTSTGGNTVTLTYNSTQALGGVGQYTIGTFTATATSQAFTVTGNSSSQLNAIQVRDTTTRGYFSGASATLWDASTTSDWGTASGGAYNKTWTAAGGGATFPAVFEGTANTLTVNGAVSVGDITFTTDSYTLGGSGTLTLGNAAITTGSGSDTISAIIAGTAGLNKYGSGTLTLSGANTYTGGTIIGNGVLNAGIAQSGTTSGSLGASGNIIFGGGTLQFSSATASWDPSARIASGTSSGAVKVDVNGQAVTFGTALTSSQSGGLTLSDTAGGGKLTLNVAEAYTGTTTISGGTLVLAAGNGGTVGTIGTTGAGTVVNNAMLQLQATGANTLAGVCTALTGTGTANQVLTTSGTSSTIQLRGDNNVTFFAGSAATGFSGGVNNASGYTFNFDVNQLTGAGAGNAFTFGSTANGLQIGQNVMVNVTGGNNDSLVLGPVSYVTTVGTLTFNPTTANLSMAGFKNNQTSAATLTLGGISAGNVVNGVIANSTGTGTPASVVIKTNTSTWTLSGVNTYSGATTVKGGKLVGQTGGSCASSAVAVTPTLGVATLGVLYTGANAQWSCSSLSFNSGGSGTGLEFAFNTTPSTTTAPLSISGTVAFTSTPTVTVDPANLASGTSYPLLVVGGTPPVTGVPTTATIGRGLTGTLAWGTGSPFSTKTLVLTVSGTATEPLAWNTGAAGSGTWDINNSGNTIWKDNAAANTYYQESGVIGDQVSFDDSSSHITANTTVTLNSVVNPASVTVNNSSYNYTLSGSGSIAGNTTLTKSGSKTLIVATANTFSGGTTVNAGTLQIGNGGTSGSLGSGGVSSTATTTIAFNRTDAATSPFVVNNTISSTSGGSYGTVVVNSGAVQLAGTADNANTAVDVKSGATLILAKTSSGTIHAFGKPSTVESGGTLQLAGSGGDQIFDSTSLTVNSGGVFDLNSQSETLSSLSLAGTGISSGGALINSTTTATSTLTLPSGLGLTASSSIGGAGNLTIAGIISGSTYGITKIGADTLTLSGVNTYTGGTTISAGTVTIGGAGQLGGGSYAGNIANSGTLIYNSSAAQTLSGQISGTGALTQQGAGTLTLSGANNYSGATALSGGALQFQNASSLPNSAVTMSSGTTLQLRADSGTTFAPASVGFASSGTVNYNFDVNNITAGNTGNTIILKNVAAQFGPASTTDTFNLTGGNGYTLQIGSGSAGTGVLNIWNNTTINSSTAGVTLSIPGGISVNYNLTYTLALGGAGNLSLGALVNNQTSGGQKNLTPTFGGSGTIALNGADNFGAAAGTISSTGTLALNNNAALTGLSTLAINSAVTLDITSGGTVNISGTPAQTWGSDFTFGSANTTGALNLGTGTVTLGAARQVTVANSSYGLTVGGAIGGAYGLTKAGPGNLTLSGVSTFSGATTISGGTLTIGGAGQLGSGSYAGNIANSGTLVYNSSVAQTLSGQISGTGALTQQGAGTLTLAPSSGNNSYGGLTTVNGGKLVVLSSQSGTGNFTVADGADLTVTVSGTSQLQPSTLTLGSTTGATLEFNGINSTTVAPLNPTNLVSSGTLTLKVNSGTFTVGGIYPLMAWTTGSAPTANLSSMLALGISAHLASTSTNISLVIDSISDIWTGVSSGNWDTTATGNWTGHATIYTDGDSVLFDDTATGTTSIAVNQVVQPGGVVVNNSTKNYIVASSSGKFIGGSTSLTKTGSGTLTLSGGVNTNTGVTSINGGIVSVSTLANGGAASDIGSAANSAANVTLNGGTLQYTGAATSSDRLFTLGASGATLDASGTGALNLNNSGSAGLSGSGARTLALIGTNTAANTLAAVIGDNGGATAVSKSGAGSWTLAGANTYSGATTLSAGTLALSGSGTLGNGSSALTVGGGTLDLGTLSPSVGAVSITGAATIQNGSLTGTSFSANLASGTATLSANLLGSGSAGFTLSGAGAVMLSGVNAWTGPTIVNAGTLTLLGNQNSVTGGFYVGTNTSPASLNIGTATQTTATTLTVASGNLIKTASGASQYSTINVYGANAYPTYVTNNSSMSIGRDSGFTVNAYGNWLQNSDLTIQANGGYPGNFTVAANGIFTYAGTALITNSAPVSSGNASMTINGTFRTGQGIYFDDSGSSGYPQLTLASGGALSLSANIAQLVTTGGSGPVGKFLLGTGGGVIDTAGYATTIGFPIGNVSGQTGALTKQGSGTLTMSTANTYSGATTVSAGALALTDPNAVQNSALTLSSGATLQLRNDSALSFNSSGAVLVSGVDSSVNIDVNNNSTGSGNALTLANGLNYSYNLTSAGTHTETVNITGNNGYTLTVPTVLIKNLATASSGHRHLQLDVNPTSASASLGNVTGFPDTSASDINSELILDGTSTGNQVVGAIAKNGSSGGTFNVFKNGSGTWTLSGTNTYDGTTTVSAGMLVLNGNGSLISPTITVAGGATFDVSGLSVVFTLSSTQTLANSGLTAANLGGNLNTGSGTISLSFGAGTPSLNVANGTLNLSSNTVFNVNNIGTALSAGSYKLIGKLTGGAVAGSLPTVTVTGGGTTAPALLQVVNGELYLTVGTTALSLVSVPGGTNGYLDNVTFTAMVLTNGSVSANASGTVLFSINGTAVVTNGLNLGGTNLSLSTLPRGTNLIAAVYSGDANYLPSTNNLYQVVTNHPPVAGNASYTRNQGIYTMRIPVAELLTNVTDSDSDTITLVSTAVGSNGVTVLTVAVAGTNYLYYYCTNNVADQFDYTVTDGFGGTNTGTVLMYLNSTPVFGQENAQLVSTNGGVQLTFFGVPGNTYVVQRNLTLDSGNWQDLSTNSATTSNPVMVITDTNNPQAFYRLRWQSSP